jgi:hypothetical protein
MAIDAFGILDTTNSQLDNSVLDGIRPRGMLRQFYP